MFYSAESLTISMPLTNADRQTAQQFAQQQPVPEKAKRIFQNTLAVLAVYHYLQLLDIATDLQAGISWNPVGRMAADVADLVLPGVGRLECRPVDDAHHCFISEEVSQNRIAYLAIHLDEGYREGKILGFIPSISDSELLLDQLRPLDEFLDYLAALEEKQLTHLREWLIHHFATEWKPAIELLHTSKVKPDKQFRGLLHSSSVQTLVEQIYSESDNAIHKIAAEQLGNLEQAESEAVSKAVLALTHLIKTTEDEETRWIAAESLWMIDPGNPVADMRRVSDLGMQLAGHTIALMVAVLPKGETELAVLLRIYPMGEATTLPPGLELRLLDEKGHICNPIVRARGLNEQVFDQFIQLKLYGQMESQFSVQIILGEASLTKHFTM